LTDSPESQITKVVDEAVARRDRSLPTWAAARLTRLFRELDAEERPAVVERVCERPGIPAGLASDVGDAAARAANPAPTPPPAPPPAARTPTAGTARPKSTSSRPAAPRQAMIARTSTFKARKLDDIPEGTRVEYQGRGGVIEPPWLVLDDGRKFKFLNPAAVYINGGVEVNGWDAWRVEDGRSLGECYDSGSWPDAPTAETTETAPDD